jgi:hypothetical protein
MATQTGFMQRVLMERMQFGSNDSKDTIEAEVNPCMMPSFALTGSFARKFTSNQCLIRRQPDKASSYLRQSRFSLKSRLPGNCLCAILR